MLTQTCVSVEINFYSHNKEIGSAQVCIQTSPEGYLAEEDGDLLLHHLFLHALAHCVTEDKCSYINDNSMSNGGFVHCQLIITSKSCDLWSSNSFMVLQRETQDLAT